MSSHTEGSSQAQASQGSNNEDTKKRKGRELAKKIPNCGKRRLIIQFDEDWNVCGGEQKELAAQLGVFVKNGKLFPLTKENWNDINEATKERIWTDIQKNTNVPPK